MDLTVGLISWTTVCSMDWLYDCWRNQIGWEEEKCRGLEKYWWQSQEGSRNCSRSNSKRKSSPKLLWRKKNDEEIKRAKGNKRGIGVRTEEQKGKGGQRGECGSYHRGGTSTGRVSKTGGEVKWRAVKSFEKRARAHNNCLLSFWHPPPHLPLSVSQHSRQTACSYWPTPTRAAQTLAAREGWGGRANLLQPKQASVNEKWRKRPKNAKWGLGERGSALKIKFQEHP